MASSHPLFHLAFTLHIVEGTLIIPRFHTILATSRAGESNIRVFLPLVAQPLADGCAPLTLTILNTGVPPICPAFHLMQAQATPTFAD